MAQKHSGFFADFVKCEFRPAHGGRFNVWEELPGTTRPIIEGFTARIQYAPKAQRQRIAMDMVTKRATGKSPPYKPKVIVVYECRTGNDRRPDDVVSKALEAFVASALDNLRLKPKRDKDAHTLEQILRGQVALRWFDRDQAIGDDYITWRFSQDWQPPIKRRTPVDDASVVYELGSRVESGKPPKADIILFHGLDGHYLNTWCNPAFGGAADDGKFDTWIDHVLLQEPRPGSFDSSLRKGKESANPGYDRREVPPYNDIRLLSVKHDLNTTDTSQTAHTVEESVRRILRALRLCTSDDHDRPKVLIGHSLGCLLIKEVLLLDAKEKAKDPEYLGIERSVRGVIFYGGPHNGSGLATSMESLGGSSQLKIFGSRGPKLSLEWKNNTPAIAYLSRSVTSTEHHNQVNKDFFGRKSCPSFVNFQETCRASAEGLGVEIALDTLIVQEDESDIRKHVTERVKCHLEEDLPFSNSVSSFHRQFRVKHDHLGICAPAWNRHDEPPEIYLKTRRAIWLWLAEARRVDPPPQYERNPARSTWKPDWETVRQACSERLMRVVGQPAAGGSTTISPLGLSILSLMIALTTNPLGALWLLLWGSFLQPFTAAISALGVPSTALIAFGGGSTQQVTAALDAYVVHLQVFYQRLCASPLPQTAYAASFEVESERCERLMIFIIMAVAEGATNGWVVRTYDSIRMKCSVLGDEAVYNTKKCGVRGLFPKGSFLQSIDWCWKERCAKEKYLVSYGISLTVDMPESIADRRALG